LAGDYQRPGDGFCSIAVYRSFNFGFNRGSGLTDQKKPLSGNGNVYRYLKLHELKDFPVAYAKKLLKEAPANALARFKEDKQVLKGAAIVKSISQKKRRI
jgi:hypothetical protein